MLKILLAAALFTLLSASKLSPVFICDSENAKAYHLKQNCKGLELWKHEVVKISKKKALKKGLKLCGFEK